MRLRSLPALIAVAAIAFSACSTTDSRIRRHQALFDGYPPEVQENIQNGVIYVGYSPEMVVMALGEPDRKTEMQSEDGVAEVWTYRKSIPGFAIGIGGGSYVGSHVGIGTGVTIGEPARSEDRAVIEFREGRLAARTKDLDGDGAIDITSIYREGRLGERRIEELRMAPGDS